MLKVLVVADGFLSHNLQSTAPGLTATRRAFVSGGLEHWEVCNNWEVRLGSLPLVSGLAIGEPLCTFGSF